ncbi:MAG: DUF4190 domain-containing protein [Planctomycetaceae bacterium]|jgi:hypothetical protein|nr:DUF4190 domain-containing protein [Planctomycetaceae bacterium]
MSKEKEFDQVLTKVTDEDLGETGVRVGYRAVSVLAILAFFLSLFTPLMLLSMWFVLCPLVGLLCGVWGLFRILSSPFDYTGRGFAVAGIIVSFVFALVAGIFGVWQYYYSVPVGYTVVDFLEFRPNEDKYKDNKYNINPRILELAAEHRKVYIRGYMMPGNQLAGIQDFMMVRSKAHCKFCAPEKNPFDMVTVHCMGNLRASFRMNAAHVGGELYFNENFRYGELPFHIDADLFK